MLARPRADVLAGSRSQLRTVGESFVGVQWTLTVLAQAPQPRCISSLSRTAVAIAVRPDYPGSPRSCWTRPRRQEEYGPFGESDIIHLAPTDEEREERRKALVASREAARKAKAARKLAKKSARRDQSSTIADASSNAAQEGSRGPDMKASSDGMGGGDGKGKATEEVGSERKKGKRRRREESGEAVAATPVPSGPESSRVAGAAAQAVEKSKQNSAVYASLFGKKKVSNEHLFIATAGHRYNLG